jgi:uncharacterized protein YneF (UPF0154 family)
MIWYFILVFVATIIADILWTYYIRRVSQGKAFQSALYASLVYANTVFVTIMYTENRWLGIAVVLGAFIGTYIAVKIDTRKGKKGNNIMKCY